MTECPKLDVERLMPHEQEVLLSALTVAEAWHEFRQTLETAGAMPVVTAPLSIVTGTLMAGLGQVALAMGRPWNWGLPVSEISTQEVLWISELLERMAWCHRAPSESNDANTAKKDSSITTDSADTQGETPSSSPVDSAPIGCLTTNGSNEAGRTAE